MIEWLTQLFGFNHKRGLSDEKRAELARIHAQSRRVLRRSITLRVSLMASIHKSNGSH